MAGKKGPPNPPKQKPGKSAPTSAAADRKAAKQVAATRAKLHKAMEDPEFRARIAQQIKSMLREQD